MPSTLLFKRAPPRVRGLATIYEYYYNIIGGSRKALNQRRFADLVTRLDPDRWQQHIGLARVPVRGCGILCAKRALSVLSAMSAGVLLLLQLE